MCIFYDFFVYELYVCVNVCIVCVMLTCLLMCMCFCESICIQQCLLIFIQVFTFFSWLIETLKKILPGCYIIGNFI